MAANVPTVFVSSTCYDLQQIRADLKGFIETFGYNSMLSNYDSFPINPDLGTVENCLRAVDEFADIFILVVGGRYGSPGDEEKSVTNLEYLRGRAKGVPVYAFVHRSIIDYLPLWKANPDMDFKSVVDSPKLFEFVTSLRDSGEVWVFPFDLAQDIISALRNQWAHLFKDSLRLRNRIRTSNLSERLLQLQGESLRLVIERPFAWEYKLFSEALFQEIIKSKTLRMDLDNNIALGRGEHFGFPELLAWIRRKNAELLRILSSLKQLFNVALKEAMGPPGIAGDPEGIVYVVQRIGESYRHAIEWTLDCQRIYVDEEFQTLVKCFARLSHNMIKEIEDYSTYVQTTIKESIAAYRPGVKQELNLTLTLTVDGGEEFGEELERINTLYGIN